MIAIRGLAKVSKLASRVHDSQDNCLQREVSIMHKKWKDHFLS